MLSFTFLYASFWRRTVACLIDVVIIALVSVFILDPSINFLGLREASETLRKLPFSVVILRVYGLWVLLTLIFAWLYFALQESSGKRATLGKRFMGLIVFTRNEERITFRAASVRFWSKLLSASLAFGGFFMALFDDRHRALHDRLARTQVLQPSDEAFSPMRQLTRSGGVTELS